MKTLDLYTKRIDHALDTVDRLVHMIPPQVDTGTKVTLLQTLLPDLLPPGEKLSYASALSLYPPQRRKGMRQQVLPLQAARWLKPQLERFERQREQMVSNPRNRYLLVAPNKTRHNTPASHVFIWRLVRQASVQALGVACNPNTLRKTAAVMFADHAGADILRWMGWDYQQAFAYTWAAPGMLHPQQLGDPQTLQGEPQQELITFPSPKERTQRCDD